MRKLLLIKKKMNEEIIMSIRQGAFIRERRCTQSVVEEGFYYRRGVYLREGRLLDHLGYLK